MKEHERIRETIRHLEDEIREIDEQIAALQEKRRNRLFSISMLEQARHEAIRRQDAL